MKSTEAKRKIKILGVAVPILVGILVLFVVVLCLVGGSPGPGPEPSPPFGVAHQMPTIAPVPVPPLWKDPSGNIEAKTANKVIGAINKAPGSWKQQ